MPANPKPLSPHRMARRRARRRLALRTLAGVALLAALLIAGHALLWRWMGSQLQDGFAAWAGERRAQGWRVEHAAPVRGGWPFSATLTLPRFRLAGGGPTLPSGMEWQAEALRLQVSLSRVDRLVVEMPGRHRLRIGNAAWPFAADRLVAELPMEHNVLPRAAVLEAARLRIGIATGAGAGTLEVRRSRLEIETRTAAIEGEPAVTLHGMAEGMALPGLAAGEPTALGRTVQQLALDMALTGPVPPSGGPAGRARAWRDGGGTLGLRGLDLRWGPVAASGTATMTLDDALQPRGAGTLKVTGAAEALDAAAAAGLLAPGTAGMARMAARLLERPPADGGGPVLEVPLTLERQTLTLARIPLAKLGAWTWSISSDAVQNPSVPPGE